MINEAIILAGGLGTRLSAAISNLPKCMAPINDIPFIDFVIEYLQSQKINRFVFSLGYKNEIIIKHLDEKYSDVEKIYVVEEQSLGTGGAIKFACEKVLGENIVVVNGDTLFKIHLESLFNLHLQNNANCTIALKPMTNFSRYGEVEINNDNIVIAFKEKQFTAKGFINGGIYVLNKKNFLKQHFPVSFSFEKAFLEKNTSLLFGKTFDNYFIDIGIPEDYIKAQIELIDNN